MLKTARGDLHIAILDKEGEFTVMQKSSDRGPVRRHLVTERST